MPGIRLCGRRFSFSSDDLTLPSLIDIALRLPFLITFIVFRVKDVSPDATCPSSFYSGYFYPLLSLYGVISILDFLIFLVSLLGSPMKNNQRRQRMPLLLYIRLLLVIADIGINIMGLVIIVRVFHSCDVILRATIITSIVLSWSLASTVFFMLAFFIDLTGFVSPEKKWETRMKVIFCCGRGYGGQSSDIKNIIKTLQYLFDDERFDLVPSDLAAGLILLQEEDFMEERSIDISQTAPLDLLEEGLYYNTYAQSAFGWFSLAYQYRLTFLPRMLFSMHFRTVGFCCGCCGCCAYCCPNRDSLNDPCGSQYSALTYLLRQQRPVIIYANFLGALHRAPFYIAADNNKKTIVVAVRGTLSATDILTDINAVEDVLETELFGNGFCHSGMHLAAKFIYDDIAPRLQTIFQTYPDYSLVICGYSLGAGIAAILSILFKPKYPSLKCYGIAMPGSVLSPNLAVATRDFIFAYAADVDMITRASIRSLSHLRDRILDALTKCNRNKARILTMSLFRAIYKRRPAFRTMNSQTTSLCNEQRTTLPSDTTSTSQSAPFVSENENDQREQLVIPGTIVHLYSTNRPTCCSPRISFRAYMGDYRQFQHIIVHPRMWFDHFPGTYAKALNYVVENYDELRHDLV